MEGVGGGGCIGSVGINSFFFSLPFFSFFSPGQCTGIWLLLLAIFIYLFILYYIIYMALGFTSLYFTWAEILGGNLSLCLV